jgi:hypothetical protein
MRDSDTVYSTRITLDGEYDLFTVETPERMGLAEHYRRIGEVRRQLKELIVRGKPLKGFVPDLGEKNPRPI